LPDGIFSNQKSLFGIFGNALEYTSLVYFMAIRNFLQTFGMFHGHLVYHVAILVYFSRFGLLQQ
jgi:hypothetical protein